MMLNERSFLAIIPARGGSKRLQRKNVLDLAGKPLIAWTIEAALNSISIDEVVVSTDDQETAEIAEQYGASVPFIRPDELALDSTTTFDTIKHTLDFYAENGQEFDFTVLLQPTSPLRESRHVVDAINLLVAKSADAIVSVTAMSHSPLWANTLPDDGSMSAFLRDEIKNKPSQALETYFQLNGAIYICKTAKLLSEKSFFLKDKIFAYRMDRQSSVDIDDEVDFLFAASLMCQKEIR